MKMLAAKADLAAGNGDVAAPARFQGALALSFILASACATPQLAHTVTEVAATASHRVAPNIVAVTTHSPAGAHHYTAGAVVPHPVNHVAPSAPAVSTTGHQPATPHVPIPVPTVLKGSVPYNAPIVKGQIEVHRVQNPGLVERRAEVPCDVPECQENIVKVPTPVHVDAPYNVHVPTKPLRNVYRKLEAPRLAVSATRRLCRCANTMDSAIKSKEEQWTVKSKAKKDKKKQEKNRPVCKS